MRHQTAALVLALLLTLALSAVSAEQEKPKPWEAPRPVKLTGVDACFNYCRSYLAWASGALKDRPAGLLVRDGDLVGVTKEKPFFYRKTDGTSLSVSAEELTLKLGDHMVGLKLEKGDASWKWLEGAAREDLARLRFLEVADLEPARVPALKKLAEANPGLGLAVDDEEAAAEVLPLFRPQALLGSDFLLDKKRAALAAGLGGAQLLGFEAKKGSFEFLAGLPSLRTLLLTGWDPEATSPLLPAGGERLDSLILAGGELDDLVPIAHLATLRELQLHGCKKLTDIGALAQFKELKALSLANCEKLTDLSALKGLAGLECLSLPPGASQEQLAAAIRDHPSLRVVELVKCGNVADLAPLQGLRNLEALVLIGVPADRTPLRQMKGLRFLALDKEVFEKSPDEVAKLEKELPQCLVVAGEGMCLGSGWILVLLAAMPVAWLVGRRRRLRTESRGGGV